MSISPVSANVAASKNCTLLAVFAVTIEMRPAGPIVRIGHASSLIAGSKPSSIRALVIATAPSSSAML